MNQPPPPDQADKPARRPGNALKVHDNSAVARALSTISNLAELRALVPGADDILVGAVHLKTAGHTATRPLSRRILFMVLKRCQQITVKDTAEAVRHKSYSRQQAERYAGVARVASKALDPLLLAVEGLPSMTLAEAQRVIDAPYQDDLARALAADACRDVSIPHLKEDQDDRERDRHPVSLSAMGRQFDLYNLSHGEFLT